MLHKVDEMLSEFRAEYKEELYELKQEMKFCFICLIIALFGAVAFSFYLVHDRKDIKIESVVDNHVEDYKEKYSGHDGYIADGAGDPAQDALAGFETEQEQAVAVPQARDRSPLGHEMVKNDPLSGYSGLTAEGKEAYDRIYSGIMGLQPEVALEDLGLSEECYLDIDDAVTQDCPEICFVEDDDVFVYDTGRIAYVAYTYKPDAQDCMMFVQSWAESVIAQMPEFGSEAEDALWIHDWLASSVEYDLAAPDNQTVLSAARGVTVCAGYTQAYSYLLHRIGIFAGYLRGQSEGGAHAWNLVRLDGEEGWVDLTFDDTGSAPHRYFGLSSSEMAGAYISHILNTTRADLNNLPGCPSAKALAGQG